MATFSFSNHPQAISTLLDPRASRSHSSSTNSSLHSPASDQFPFATHPPHAHRPGPLPHADLCGPVRVGPEFVYDPNHLSVPPLLSHSHNPQGPFSNQLLAAPNVLPTNMSYPQALQYQQHPPPLLQQQPQQPQQQQQQQQQPNAKLRHGTVENPLRVERDGLRYSLDVIQQPVRARMCGFGDKDRRPITPPPCIRLVITDVATGLEVDPNKIDSQFFVLTVDLWDHEGTSALNLIRQASQSPSQSISTTSMTSYPPPPERHLVRMETYPPGFHPLMAQTHPYGDIPAYTAPSAAHYDSTDPTNPHTPITPTTPHHFSPAGMPMPGHNPYAQLPPGPGGIMPGPIITTYPTTGPVPAAPPGFMVASSLVAHHPPNNSMFQRNLIGSLSVNAFKLVDTEKKTGFWFVLQDLSVRQEGNFRLRLSFVDIGNCDYRDPSEPKRPSTGKSPVLASCYTDPFHVYSAKKFPGVIESTPLSKTFAKQGIKIPIRKEGKATKDDDDYGDDDD